MLSIKTRDTSQHGSEAWTALDIVRVGACMSELAVADAQTLRMLECLAADAETTKMESARVQVVMVTSSVALQ